MAVVNALSDSVNSLPGFDVKLGGGVADYNVPGAAVINGMWEVPFAKSSRATLRAFLDGWQIGAIFKALDGIPFTPQIAGDPLGQKSAATIDFSNRLTGLDCGSAFNSGKPRRYIRTHLLLIAASSTLMCN